MRAAFIYIYVLHSCPVTCRCQACCVVRSCLQWPYEVHVLLPELHFEQKLGGR